MAWRKIQEYLQVEIQKEVFDIKISNNDIKQNKYINCAYKEEGINVVEIKFNTKSNQLID